jgi:hypothetical protein
VPSQVRLTEKNGGPQSRDRRVDREGADLGARAQSLRQEEKVLLTVFFIKIANRVFKYSYHRIR